MDKRFKAFIKSLAGDEEKIIKKEANNARPSTASKPRILPEVKEGLTIYKYNIFYKRVYTPPRQKARESRTTPAQATADRIKNKYRLRSITDYIF